MSQDIVRVTPNRGPGGEIQWKVCHNTVCGGPGSNPPTDYPVIDVPADKQEHVFVITIDDQQNTGVTFASDATNPSDPAKALAVVPGKGNHPTSGINSDNQFKDITLASPTTLVLTDKNSNQSELWLSYALNFVGRNGQPVTSIDPDWKNGGGGSGAPQMVQSAATATLLISLAALATIVFVAFRQASIRRMVSEIWTRSK